MKKLTPKEALIKTRQICSKQEKCISEISTKLKDWQITEEEQNKIIENLLFEKFIDENRYATIYTREKFKFNKWGKIKIRYSLKQLNISTNIIEEALETIDPEEYINLINSELIKKRKTINTKNKYQIRNKMFNFALGRGFESDLIKTEIDKIQAL